MMVFKKETLNELRGCLYSCAVVTHDALFEDISLDKINKTARITLYASYEAAYTDMIFKNVRLFFFVETNLWGTDESIYSVDADESLTGIEHIVTESKLDTEHLIHFNFQMFSGNEIHILCEEICVGSRKKTVDGLREPS